MWSLEDARIQRIFRLPIDFGDIGKALAVAISPDGNTIAVGGIITIPSHGYCIFLFDRASGELRRRLTDLPSPVSYLTFSPDGLRLAASLLGSYGIRVFDTASGYRLQPSDTDYKNSSVSARFDWAGGDRRPHMMDLSGSMRPINMHPHWQIQTGGYFPHSAAFSPDGTRVAVGYENRPKVVVLSASIWPSFSRWIPPVLMPA